MSLDSPYLVYGTITVNFAPFEGTIIYVQDTTLGSAILDDTTDSNGQYTIDIESIANDGDVIHVWCSYGESYFTLDVSGPMQLVDFSYPDNRCVFTVQTAYQTDLLLFNVPYSISFVDSRNLAEFHFWSGTSYTVDVSKAAEIITLNGVESSSTNLHILDSSVDNGYMITLAGLSDDMLNTSWVIKSFSFGRESYSEYPWSLTLEKK